MPLALLDNILQQLALDGIPKSKRGDSSILHIGIIFLVPLQSFYFATRRMNFGLSIR